MKDLFQAILKLKTDEEAWKFFRDLCTEAELKAMAERFEAAQQINEGRNYRDISKETGLSTATVTRVAYWLHHGMGGYQLVLKRLNG